MPSALSPWRQGWSVPLTTRGGNLLLPGGPGNTSGDAGAFATIMDSLRRRLSVLDDATWAYLGHGDDTTIGTERPALDEWEARGW